MKQTLYIRLNYKPAIAYLRITYYAQINHQIGIRVWVLLG